MGTDRVVSLTDFHLAGRCRFPHRPVVVRAVLVEWGPDLTVHAPSGVVAVPFRPERSEPVPFPQLACESMGDNVVNDARTQAYVTKRETEGKNRKRSSAA